MDPKIKEVIVTEVRRFFDGCGQLWELKEGGVPSAIGTVNGWLSRKVRCGKIEASGEVWVCSDISIQRNEEFV